jgi:hypothetical protein
MPAVVNKFALSVAKTEKPALSLVQLQHVVHPVADAPDLMVLENTEWTLVYRCAFVTPIVATGTRVELVLLADREGLSISNR